MNTDDDLRSEVLRISRKIETYARRINADNRLVGAALLEVGLRVATRSSQREPSEADKELIREHYPDATDDNIATHCLTQEGLRFLLSLTVGYTRKYLDHQPRACVPSDVWTEDAKVKKLVSVVTRNIKNAYASARSMGVSAYDVAAATITNASILASESGVPLEQIAILHLEGIETAADRAPY